MMESVSLEGLECIVIRNYKHDQTSRIPGNVNYWYSNSDSIAYWSGSGRVIYYQKLSSSTSFPFETAITHAKDQWNACLPVSLSLSSTLNTSVFRIFGGAAGEFASLGYTTNFSNLNGITYYSASYIGDWYYPSDYSFKSGYKMTSATCLIVNKGHTEAQYKNTATHEMGHALGWLGHSLSPSDVMYTYGTSVTNLTNRDMNHLNQVY